MIGRWTRRRALVDIIVLAAVLVWIAMSGGGLAAGDQPLLNRKLRLDLWGVTLNEAAQEINRQVGAQVVFYRPDFLIDADRSKVGGKEEAKVYLVTGEIDLRLALECLSRRFGCRYHVAESGRIELSTGYGWIDPNYVMRFNSLDGIVRPGAAATSANRELKEFLRVLPMLTGDFTYKFEEAAAGDTAAVGKVITVLPPVLADYFDKAIACFKGDSGDLGTSVNAGPNLPRATRIERPAWDKLLAENVNLTTGQADPRAIMREICRDRAVAFMLNCDPGTDAPRAGLLAGTTTFGRATEELGGILGLNRRVFVNPGAVVFEPGRESDWEEETKSREFFWTGLAVAGFDVKRSVDRLGEGELLKRIRTKVFPDVWYDPVCAIAYSPFAGRLVAAAPANVIEAVAVELRRIEDDLFP